MMTAVEDLKNEENDHFEDPINESRIDVNMINVELPISDSNMNSNFIDVKVLNPEKIGDGMTSYIVYTIKTTTNIHTFSKAKMCIQRRYSDFFGLFEKLKAKYLPLGVVIPYPPEKNVIGTTKLRISKSSNTGTDFIEKRRAALECFLQRITNHPTLRLDAYVCEFLEKEGELPKYSSGQVLSSATAKRLLKNVGEVVGNWAFKMDEVDEYFEFKDVEFENWDIQGNRLYSALVNLVTDQNELATAALTFSKSISVLANVEEHTGLARALGQLASTEEEVAKLHAVQAEAESTYLMEYARGILSMLQSCRETLSERVKVFKTRHDLESCLRSKRENKVRIEMSPKADRAKIPTLEQDIGDLVHRVEESEENFEKISAAIKKELELVDESRFEEFKEATVGFITTMLQIQEKVLKSWEAFIGHAKAIE